ncbi:MAG: UvrD-helicase domain-containing protein [Pseudomonadota bacterium]
MSEKKNLADSTARDAALDAARSFIVQAPAGSGKTSLLVSRYLKLLSIVQKPEEVLAITFTRKAAAEMRKRVLEKLPNAGEIAHRLRIQTIDALCSSLTRQMPVLARFGAQPDIVEDASDLYREAAANTLLLLHQKEFSGKVEKLLSHLDNNVATAISLLASMLAKRDQWLRNAGHPPTRAQLEATLLAERERLFSAARNIDPRASEEFAKEVLTVKGEWRKKPKPAPPDIVGNEPLRQALVPLLKLPPEKYADAQWQALEAILALLIPAVKQLVLLFSIRGQVDFTEISRGALTALGSSDDPSELLLSLDARISHILVDEFQDTSISQWELLERLTAGWQKGDGRTVLAVGDPMQSIYRFREAEVGLFLHARHAGVGSVKLEPLTLSTNFRSQAGIVDWVNGFFPNVLPSQPDETSGAVPYSPSTTHAPALPGAAVAWHGFFDRESESRKAVELVKASSGTVGTVAILVRNRSHLDAIVPALKAAGIRYRAVEIEQLGEKQVVQDLYALTRALLHPADRIAWLAILRAPWVGLDLSDLSKLFENKGDQTIWQLIQNVPTLDRFRNVLAPAIANRMRGRLRERVEGAWLALGGPACVESETDLEDAAIYLDELERLEEAGGLPELKVLEDKLEKLWALPDVGAGPDCVEIMTIHKAKGLEWDTVIVPGLDRAPRSGDRQLFAWKSLSSHSSSSSPRTRGSSLLLAPINETGSDKEPLYEYVRRLDKDAEDIEAGRLFYVAATRARSRLHLLACAKPDEAGAPKAPNKRSLLAKAWLEGAPHFPSLFQNLEVKTIDSVPAPQPPQLLRRLPAAYTVPPPPPPAAWEAPPEGRDEADRIEFSWAGETARHVGTVVHRWLQRIAEDELKGWDAKRVESLRPRFKKELERRGVQASELIAASDLVVAALANTIADDRGRWLLGPHSEARSEYRLRTAARRLVIDRVLRDEEGRRWIVDFKTSRHTGADVDGFLDRERERYRAQLERYAAALGDGRPALYFPLHRGWRELPEE